MTLYTSALEAMERISEPKPRVYTWADYNIAKLEWLQKNKDATPEQIQDFCTKLAREMGL